MALRASTSSRLEPVRHGVALLLVLAMIVLIVPVAVGFSQRALLARLEERHSGQGHIADSIRAQLESGPIQHWLSAESGKVVLPVEAPSSRVDILHEQWQFDDCPYEVRVTAWDQCGMTPWSSIVGGSPLHTAIPGGILKRVNAANVADAAMVGLDQFSLDPSELNRAALRSAFPSPDENDVLSVGAWIATHPVGPNGAINVNTAPLPLVEAAMAAASRGGIEIILAARSDGRVAPLPRTLERDTSVGADNAPRLVGSSSCWSVRIDVRVGSMQRSWWTVYRQVSGRWECVQRLVIID